MKADPNAICENGNTPMHMVLASNNTDMIIDMIRIGVLPELFKGSLDTVNIFNMTPIAFAS